ncbi:MAG: pilin [Patescibacteria group bacterium]
MLKRIKNYITSLAVALLTLAPMAVPAVANAQTDIEGNLCAGANLDTNAVCDPEDTEATDKVNSILELVINIFSLVVGVISVIMIIIGGLKYITSGGESTNITGAKNTILYAIIGLVVVALAQIIVRFVLSRVSSAGN